MAPNALIRPMGLTEALCAEWYEAIPFGLQVVGAVALDRPLSLERLQDAAERVKARHPLLSSGIERINGDWWFTESESTTADIRLAPTGSSWRDRFAAAQSTLVDLRSSPWFVELVSEPTDATESSVVMVVGCHAIFDGIALAQVLRELIDDSADTSRESPLPAMEDFLPARAIDLTPPTMTVTDQWQVEQQSPATDRSFGFLDRFLDATTVDALHKRTKEEHTTIASALAVACCRARRTLTNHGEVVGFNIPFDARRHTNPPLPNNTVGAYFGRAHVYGNGTTSDNDPWSEARRLDVALRAEIEHASRPARWDSRDVAAQVAELCRDNRESFDLDVLLTDLGTVELGPDARGLWFTTVQTTGLEAFVVSVATCNGVLALGVGWPQPLVSDATALAFTDALVQEVQSLATPN